MNIQNWMKNKIINLLAMLRHDKDRPSSLTIIPNYEVAFILALGRAYDRPDKKVDEFINSFYDELERYLVAVGGKAREDIKEVYTRREFFDKFIGSRYEPEEKEDEGVRLV